MNFERYLEFHFIQPLTVKRAGDIELMSLNVVSVILYFQQACELNNLP